MEYFSGGKLIRLNQQTLLHVLLPIDNTLTQCNYLNYSKDSKMPPLTCKQRLHQRNIFCRTLAKTPGVLLIALAATTIQTTKSSMSMLHDFVPRLLSAAWKKANSSHQANPHHNDGILKEVEEGRQISGGKRVLLE